MLQFTTIIERFAQQGEKTGWTYIALNEKQVTQLKPGAKVSFRVKGKIDDHAIEKIALLPMGNGTFILALNAGMRKAIKKGKGDQLNVQLLLDEAPLLHDGDFLECLQDEPAAMETFYSLPKGHQNYFSKWIESAKTAPTKAKRIAMAVNALATGMGFPEMMRERKKVKQQLGF